MEIDLHDILISQAHMVVLGTNQVKFTHEGGLADRFVDVYHIDDKGKIREIWAFSGGETWKGY